MKLPTISVIMPTYNHADFVAQAIDSVLRQRGVEFEFLIADDGSVDRTRDVILSINDKKVRFFPSEINMGACVVINELIQRASGEFIALMNSDDYWIDGDKLAYQLQVMRDNPAVGACFGRARFVDKHGRAIDKSSLPFGRVFDQENRSQGAWLRRFFELGNCICHPTMLIRRSCYDEVGMYSNRLRQLPDLDMWVRLVKRYPIYISERELINFRVLPGDNTSSQSARNSIRNINEHYLIADTFFDHVDAEHLIDGFEDVLKYKDIPTDEHLDIETALLYFIPNRRLGKPYQMIGLLKLNRLLNSPVHYELLTSAYGIDDRWFHEKMGNVDVLRSQVVSALGYQKSRLRHICQRYLSKLFHG
jgi:glycosyltransferase involved in cell wall biosynthesis